MYNIIQCVYITEELHRLWELLLSKLAEKGMKLQQALVLVQFLRHCDEVMFWINDKVCTYILICIDTHVLMYYITCTGYICHHR